MKYHYFEKVSKELLCLACCVLLLFSTALPQTKTTTIDYGSYSGVGLSENDCNAFMNFPNVHVRVNGLDGYTLTHYSTVGGQRYFQSKGTVDLPVLFFSTTKLSSGYSTDFPVKSGYSYKISVTASCSDTAYNADMILYVQPTLPNVEAGPYCDPQGVPSGFNDLIAHGYPAAFNRTNTVNFPQFTIATGYNGYLNMLADLPGYSNLSLSIHKITIEETAPDNISCSLSAPVNLSYSFNPDNTTSLSWSPVANAFQYLVTVNDTHNGVTTEQKIFANTTSISYCGAGSGDIVYFVVQAICDNDMPGAASPRTQFTIPYPAAPTNFSYDFANCNKLQWEPINGAGSYILQLQDLTAGTGPVTFATPNYTAYVESDLHLISSHNYQATVSAVGGNACNYQTQASAPITFTASTPYLTAPTGLSYDGSANTLSWTANPNAFQYSIQYRDVTANTGTQYATVNFINSISGTALSLINGHSYQASVAAINPACNNYTSAYSGWYAFTAGPPPPPPCLPPTIVYPTAIGNKMVQVMFQAPGSGQTPANYNIKLDNGASQFFNNVGTTSPVVVRSNGTGLYTLSMQSVCPTGTSNYVNWYNQINVSSTRPEATATDNVFGDAGTDANESGFRVYPVPSTGQVWLSFQSAEKQTAEIVVSNAAGSIVLKKKIGVIGGQNTYPLDTGQLANGFYTIRIISRQSSQLQKLIIQK